eukprot:CAMPEP_0203973834 /NCGR_PEP_ID=MMETSP0359-20131031/99792_1 /ASSEMBLY_ACC=CAM_ASM_000338 /TAXON_ID=268821 /ORGANISM="Scrippsiella Hangoei, Strain SHTV-5" /LENGTH=501 /DNA_ID=CAMNT_0050911999 /DNA_START=94 /DNA_END=1601 /DNA_ORIENTATION=+
MANPADWGSIKEVLNAPLVSVPWDASWISVFFMWLLLPFNLIQGSSRASLGASSSASPSAVAAAPAAAAPRWAPAQRPPLYLAFNWWRYIIAGLTGLIANGKSRLALFMWEWAAFGKDRYWWHGEGVWMWSYADCDKVLKSEQSRQPAFGAIKACVPDLFPTNLLIFLSNAGDNSEWGAIRKAVHHHFLDHGCGTSYHTRVKELPMKIAADWSSPKLKDLSDLTLVQKTVCKCVFYMCFGKWLEEADALIMIGWRTNATMWILPRLVHRFIFNFGIGTIKTLREKTVAIVEKYELQQAFVSMNSSLDASWQRKPVVKLCDEIMFGIGFAGIGGTCAACESLGCFLQMKIPPESAAKHIQWGEYNTSEKMVAKYKEDPEKYIKETCRLDPPVTSATASLKEHTFVTLAGKDFSLPAGLLNQYVLSMANRDPSVFTEPEVFKPDRGNLNKALTWNGAFGACDEGSYPRICPGRYMSMDIIRAIINHAVGHTSELGVHQVETSV